MRCVLPALQSASVPLRVDDLIDRDGRACVWCGRELWRRDLTLESQRRAHREVAARELERLASV
jgi:hypothetical protein